MVSVAARPGFAASFPPHGELLPARVAANETHGLRAGQWIVAICAWRGNCIPPCLFQVEAGSSAVAAFPSKGRVSARSPAPRLGQTLFHPTARKGNRPHATAQGKVAPIKNELWARASGHPYGRTVASSGGVGGPG